MLTTIIYDVLIILTAGLIAGVASRRVGASVLVGYLIIGAVWQINYGPNYLNISSAITKSSMAG